MQFDQFGLSELVLRAVAAEGYTEATPIQQKAIPHVLAGKDLLGCAQTGTGKTAAFALPIIDNLLTQGLIQPGHPKEKRKIRVLVLAPTRELASQIDESFLVYGKHTGITSTVVFGGVNINRQIATLARGVDVLVATPGRLLDLMQQRAVSLADVSVYVLDEADRMLDMGFIHDVKRVTQAVPTARQTLLFSATMPDAIRQFAARLLRNPVEVAVTPVASTAEKIDQSVYLVNKQDKRMLLLHVLKDKSIERALVFTRTKHCANRVAETLEKNGVRAAAIHGNKSQSAREKALEGFKQKSVRVLVATDIAARGIDIDELGFVINFELPNVPEQYVHRIGRTGRAGFSGRAVSFCEREERPYLADIEKLIRQRVRVVEEHPYKPGTVAVNVEEVKWLDRGPRDENRGRGPSPRSAQGGRGQQRGMPAQGQAHAQAGGGQRPRPAQGQRSGAGYGSEQARRAR